MEVRDMYATLVNSGITETVAREQKPSARAGLFTIAAVCVPFWVAVALLAARFL